MHIHTHGHTHTGTIINTQTHDRWDACTEANTEDAYEIARMCVRRDVARQKS